MDHGKEAKFALPGAPDGTEEIPFASLQEGGESGEKDKSENRGKYGPDAQSKGPEPGCGR